MMNQQGGFRQGGGKRAQGGGGGKFQNSPNRKNQNANVKRNALSCANCNFSCSSIQILRMHFQKTNHDQVGDGKPQNERRGNQRDPDPKADAAGTIPDHIRRSVFFLNDYVHRSDREPIIGLEYVLEYRLQVPPGNIETKYFCQICEVDGDLVTMMEHLSCYRHRKMYLVKEFPFVLKAPSNSKEDRTQFMRRMAMEIEREEGTKMYKTDPTVRTAPMMKSIASKQSKQKTRWNYEGDRQRRMKKALEYLEAFEIDNDSEASTVTRLTEKLIAELKFHSDKLKEEALFPAKVARAKDVAMSIMQCGPKRRVAPQNQSQKKPANKAPPMFNKGPPETINMPQNMGRPIGPPPPNRDKPSWTPNAAFPQRGHDIENIPREQTAKPNPGPQSVPPDEEGKFLKKLKLLLSVLPQNSASGDRSQMNSKLLMLKSLLLDKTGNTPANQLPMASMTQDMASAEHAALNQQLAFMASKNPAALAQFGPNVMMQMASMVNNAVPMENAQMDQNSLMQMATLLQNNQMNANSFAPENQAYVPMDPMMPMDQNAYQNPYMEQQQGYPDTFQSNEEYGFDGRMAGNYGNNNMSQYDYAAKEAPYTRVSLSPSNQRSEHERFRDDGYNQDSRRDIRSQETRPSYGGRSSRPCDDPAWAERDSDLRYGKRARRDSDRMSSHSAERGRGCPDESGSPGTNAPNLSVDLLKRIRGKDLFTVSAILSEYAESR